MLIFLNSEDETYVLVQKWQTLLYCARFQSLMNYSALFRKFLSRSFSHSPNSINLNPIKGSSNPLRVQEPRLGRVRQGFSHRFSMIQSLEANKIQRSSY